MPVFTCLMVVSSAAAATTISTSISTAGTLAVTGASTLTGNVTAAGTLAVTGASTFTGLITANGGVTLGAGDDLIGSSTSDITINTDKFTVAGDTGNTVIAGTLGVTGASTLTGLLTTNGDITMSNGATLVNTDGDTLTVTEATLAISGNETVSGTLGVTGATTLTGALDLNNKLDVGDVQTGGASNGTIIKKTLQAGEDYTGTTAGLMVKNYFADTTATVSSGEFTGLYVNVKQLAALAGDQSSLISGHNYGSGGDYQALHAGIWLYGDLVNVLKVSGDNNTNGINFSLATFSGSDIILSNDETIDNVTDGAITFGGLIVDSAGILEQTSDAASDLTAAELRNHVLVFQDAVDDAITLTFGGDILANVIPDGGSVEYIFVNESGGILTIAADQNATILSTDKTIADNEYARITVIRIGTLYWVFMDVPVALDAGDVT